MSKKNRERQGGLVYSTEFGRIDPNDGVDDDPILGDGNVKVSRESKGRGGKVVTLVSGLALRQSEIKALAKTLKKECGVGGAVKQGVIEIQGEHRDSVLAKLLALGYSAKKSGG